MIGSIISGVAGLASGIVGGVKAGKERRKAEQALKDEQAFNESIFNKEYYSDPLERSDNAALLSNLRRMLDKRDKQTAATAAIMGSTSESVVAANEQSGETMSNAMGNISALNSRYKDNVMNRYLNQRSNLYNQQQGVSAQNAQGWSNFMQNGLGAMASGVSSFNNANVNQPLQAPANQGVTVPKVKIPTKFGE